MWKLLLFPLFFTGCLFVNTGESSNGISSKDVIDTKDSSKDAGPRDIGSDSDLGQDTPDSGDMPKRAIEFIVTSSEDSGIEAVCPSPSQCTLSKAIALAKVVAAEGDDLPLILFEVTRVDATNGYLIDFPVKIDGENKVTLAITEQTNGTAFRLSNGASLYRLSITGSGMVGVEMNNSVLQNVSIDGFTEGVRFTGPGTLLNVSLGAGNSTGVYILPAVTKVKITDTQITSSDTGILIDSAVDQEYEGETEEVVSISGGEISKAMVGISIKRNWVVIKDVLLQNNTTALKIDVASTTLEATVDPIKIVGSEIINNETGIKVTRANGLILGGSKGNGISCLEDCNLISGNSERSLDIVDAKWVKVQGNVFGFTSTGGILANKEGPTFKNIDRLEIGEQYDVSTRAKCKFNCNFFGPITRPAPTDLFDPSLVKVEHSNLEFHGNVINSHESLLIHYLLRNGLSLHENRDVRISRNRIFNAIWAIEVSGRSDQSTNFINLIEDNRLGEFVQGSSTRSIERGLNFFATTGVDLGQWKIENNVVKHVDTGMVFEGKMGDQSVIVRNTITEDVSGNAINIRTPNLIISNNEFTAASGKFAMLILGETSTNPNAATNIEISGNTIGRSLSGNPIVGIALRAGPKDIRIHGNTFKNVNYPIDTFRSTIDKNPNSGTFQHFDNTFPSGTVLTIRDSDGPIGASNDPEDIDIGPNTILNAPFVRESTGTEISGSLSVHKAKVRAYIDNGTTISSAPAAVTCTENSADRSFICTGLAVGELAKYKFSAEARIFELSLTLVTATLFKFTVGSNPGTQVSHNSALGDTLNQIAERIRSSADEKAILVNHDCRTNVSECLLWVIVDPDALVTVDSGFDSIINLGIATSDIVRQPMLSIPPPP